MAGFVTKLKLISEKFFQPSGSTLQLSGNTNIAETGDLRYSVHPNFTDDTQMVDKKYVDDMSADLNTGITASTTYSLDSPSTVDVGGLDAGSNLTGFTSNEILEKILVATLYPELVPPSGDFTIYSNSNRTTTISSTYEVGQTETFYTRATFDRGAIDPQYDATSPYRAGAAIDYAYTGTDLPTNSTNTSNSDDQTITDYTIQLGNNEWSSFVNYSEGVQPYDSKGNEYDSPLPAGSTDVVTVSTEGIYPYFYGTSSTEPTLNQTLIGDGTKELSKSDGTVSVNYGTTGSVYYWLAIPSGSTSKEGYYFSDLNKGNIGGENDLFGPETTGTIDEPNNIWQESVTYKFYATQYPTDFEGDTIEYRNDPQA